MGVVAWLWPSSNYRLSYWQYIQRVIPIVTPDRQLLNAYVGHFHKATWLTCCILEIEVRTEPMHSQSHQRNSRPQGPNYPKYDHAAILSKPISAGRGLSKDATIHCYVFYKCADSVTHMIRRLGGSSYFSLILPPGEFVVFSDQTPVVPLVPPGLQSIHQIDSRLQTSNEVTSLSLTSA